MKLTYNWLREYIDTELSPAEIADHLTMLGLEVDACQPCAPELPGVVVARIEEVHPHPNADKLRLCDVNTGTATIRLVCGAPNARPGLVTAMAQVGAVLPGDFTIKPAKIRGVESHGMLCSAKELGIAEEQAGIMELDPSLPLGAPLVPALGLDDTMIEVDLTPNRPDCASVLGIAREVGGVAGKSIKPPVAETPELTGVDVPFSVEVQAVSDCPRYAARLIKGVTIGPSPLWLRQRLQAVGQRSINNVVDITNLVMLEYGQPLHAFDFNKLAGGRIVVRLARAGETMSTLDGVERKLDERMLLICDAEKPVALAGIMGGGNSEVDEATVDVLLESACFDAISIRRTAGKLNMSTEASYRFERGVDPLLAPKAMERAVRLMAELAGGEVVSGGVDFREGVKEIAPLTLRVKRVRSLLGLDITADRIAALLKGIEIPTEKIDDETLRVTPPSFRVDLEREVDLIEEVARLAGYNNLPTSLPLVPMNFPTQDPLRVLRTQVAQVLTSQGFSEAINYSFVAPQHCDLLGLANDDALRRGVHLLNPLAEDQSVMRTSLLPGILENVRRNVNHQNLDLRLFEIGKVFLPKGEGQPNEPFRLAAMLSGRRNPGASLLHGGEVQVDVLDAKGTVEQLLGVLRLGGEVSCLPADGATLAYAEPGQLMVIAGQGKTVGWCGALDRKALKAFGIKQQVFFIDLDLEALCGFMAAPKAFTALPRFPMVKWDLALVVPESVAVGDMLAAVSGGDLLVERVEVFDVFRGKNVEAGKKSVAISITYRAADRTLDDPTVAKVHQKITEMMISRFNGKLREA
ncbi:MAG: phenylalanine--tRNA ligase subunit beta [Thermodesulfobacteriota bacterium]